MPHFIRTARELAKTLPILLALGGTALMPAPALANNQGPGGSDQDREGRGDRPERKVVPIQTLVRMSKAGLSDLLGFSNRIEIGGVMGNYSPGHVIVALEFAPGRTRRLIERMENTGSLMERKRIVNELLHVHSQRFAELSELKKQTYVDLRSKGRLVNPSGEKSFGQTSDDPQVEAYYRMRDEYVASYNYVELLKAMLFADYWEE